MLIYKDSILEKTTINPKSILEIGSRDGKDADELRSYFDVNSENIWIVEPNPAQQSNIINSYPNINLIKNPIFNEEKTSTFYAVDTSDQILNGTSSLLNRIDNLYKNINTNKIEIETITGSKLLSIIGKEIDLCKIDVEGATYEVLESFMDDLPKIKSIHIECEHRPVWVNQKLYNDVSDFLLKNNYIQIYFSYCNNHDLQSDSIWVLKNFIK
jgi:FkbM family methyltransferase